MRCYCVCDVLRIFYITEKSASLNIVLRTLIALQLLFIHSSNAAQSYIENDGIEVITVTAQKRLQNSQQVPMSVNAISGDKLAGNAINQLEDLAYLVPSLHIGEAAAGDQLFIRGAGSGVNQGFEQSVGLFIDDIYLGRGRFSRSPFFDLKRVEVLNGPQSSLYGKNTVAGAINIASADPVDFAEVNTSVLYGARLGEKAAELIVSGPLNDVLLARLSLRHSVSEGWVENDIKHTNMPERDEFLARFTLLFQPYDELTIAAKLFHVDFSALGRQSELSQCNEFMDMLASGDDCVFNLKTTSSAHSNIHSQEESRNHLNIFSLKFDVNRPKYTLTGIAGYVGFDSMTLLDIDTHANNIIASEQDEKLSQRSIELRIASNEAEESSWLTGVYWLDNRLDTLFWPHADLSMLGSEISSSRYSTTHQTGDSIALFAHGHVALSSQFKLGGGVRWTREHKVADKVQFIAELYQQTQTNNQILLDFWASLDNFSHDFSRERKETRISPEVFVEWHAKDNWMLYGRGVEGVKSGGFDHSFAFAESRIDDFEYEEEKAVNFEIGSKYHFKGGVWNLALFHTKYDDLQVSTFDGSANFIVGNAAKTTAKGAELDFRLRVYDDLRLGGNVTYLHSRYDDFRDAACYFQQSDCVDGLQDLSGKTTQFSPLWSVSLYGDYEFAINNYYVNVGVDAVYRGRHSIANDLDPHLWQDAYTKFNGHISITPINGDWTLSVIGKNLTNEHTFNWGNDLALASLFWGSYFKFSEKPRSILLQFKYHWSE